MTGTQRPPSGCTRRYAAIANETPKGIRLQFPGIAESFDLSTAHDEFTLFTSTWHEHFTDMDRLEGFLDGLLSGRVEIVVTYRGETPVGHKVRVQRAYGAEVVSSTGSLVPLFWRAKSCRTLSYKLPTSGLSQ